VTVNAVVPHTLTNSEEIKKIMATISGQKGKQAVASCFLPVSCMAYFSTLKMEATCYPETLVDFQWATWDCIPEDRSVHKHRCKNCKSFRESA
jgi:hypothetical protein